jgi:hypothetical protein
MGNFNRRVLTLLVLLAVAACGPKGHSVQQDSIRQYHIANVTLKGAEAIKSWPAQEKIVIEQGKLSEEQQKALSGGSPAGGFPAVRDQMQKVLQERFAAQAQNQLSAHLSGKKSATLVVTVKDFDIPSVARRMLVGGSAIRRFNIDLVDKASGQSIVLYTGVIGVVPMLQGLAGVAEAAVQGDSNDPSAEMVRAEIAQYRDWLMAVNP